MPKMALPVFVNIGALAPHPGSFLDVGAELIASNGREQFSLENRGVDPLRYWVAKEFQQSSGHYRLPIEKERPGTHYSTQPPVLELPTLELPEYGFYYLNRGNECEHLAMERALQGRIKSARKFLRKQQWYYRLHWQELVQRRKEKQRKPGAKRWISANDFFVYEQPGMRAHPRAVPGQLMTGHSAGLDRGFLTLKEAAQRYKITPEYVRDVYLKWPVVGHYHPREYWLIKQCLHEHGLKPSELTGEGHRYTAGQQEHLTPAMRFSQDLYRIIDGTDGVHDDYLDELAELSEREHKYDFERHLEETGQWQGADVPHLRQPNGKPIQGTDPRFLSQEKPVSNVKRVLHEKAYALRRLEPAHKHYQSHKGANRKQARGAGGRFVKRST